MWNTVAHLFLQIIRAEVDGCVPFGLEGFLARAGAGAEDGPRLGDGSEFREGDDCGFELLSSSTMADFLFLAISSRGAGAHSQSQSHN